MADVREAIGKALEGILTEEQIKLLFDEILVSPKKAWADITCKHCKRAQRVLCEIPDANAVVKGLTDLATQTWGRPGEAQSADEEKIHFERVIYMGDDDGEAVE